MIRCRGLGKVYEKAGRRVVALDDLDIEVKEGEFVAVVGPSGSGKSTLLMTLGGLIRPSGGEVTVAGKSLADLSQAGLARFRAQTVGFVFQLFHLVPYLSALENVLLAGYAAAEERRPGRKRAEELLASMALQERLDHTPGELSAGEQQRVALARALFNDPPLLLADEPTGNLDPARAGEVLDCLAAIHREGRTVVLVTHSPEVAQVAQRTVALRSGKLISH